jgi:O-antigen/teichoic acid export membrane protein
MHSENHKSPNNLTLRGRLGFLLQDSLLYGGASAISKSMALVTFPLLVRYFSAAEYGTLDFCLVLASVLCSLLVFGQDSAVARYFYDYEEMDQRRQMITQSLMFQLLITAVLIPLLWMGSSWIAPPAADVAQGKRLFAIVLLQLPFLLLVNFSQNILKWTFSRKQFLTISLGGASTYAALIVAAIAVFRADVEGVLLVTLANTILFGLLGLFFIRRWLACPAGFSWPRIMLPYAVPIGIICVVGAAVPAMERAFVSRLLQPEDLGYYAAGSKIAILIAILVSAFQMAWAPFSLAIHKSTNPSETYNLVLKIFVSGICILVAMLDLIAPSLITVLASERYLPAAAVVFPISMGLAIQAIGWITELGIVIEKKSHLNLYSTGLFWLTALAAIGAFTPFLGLIGVAFGSLAAHLVKSGVSAWLAQRVHPMQWPYIPVIAILGWTVSVGMLAAVAGNTLGALYHAVVQVTSILVILLISWCSLLNDAERLKTRAAILRALNMEKRKRCAE